MPMMRPAVWASRARMTEVVVKDEGSTTVSRPEGEAINECVCVVECEGVLMCGWCNVV